MRAHSAWRRLSRFVNGRPRTGEVELRRAVEGRTVLVTGASFGIGEAVARRLAQAGARLLLTARSAERLSALAGELGAAAHPVDLAAPSQVEGLVEWVLRHGRPDVVVSNAGKSIRRSVAASSGRFHDFQRTIAVNYLGPVQLLLGLLPSMRARGAGHVVNVSTVGIRLPAAPRWGGYHASKAAFDVWFRSLAPEIRNDDVRTTTVYMGLVHTRMSEPTAVWRRMPGLLPDEAAGLVCDAVVLRPRQIAPWWAGPVDTAGNLLRGPVERLLGATYRAEGTG